MAANKNCIHIVVLISLLMIIYVVFNMSDKKMNLSTVFVKFFVDTEPKYDIQFSQDYIRKYFNESDPKLGAHWLRIIQHYLPLPLESSYGSHKVALLAASILTGRHGGPVMEMGCGHHSTALLHQIVVNEQNRYLLSTDTDREWLSKFEANMSSSIHQFRFINLISEWDGVSSYRPRWSIVFVDHKPGERRVIDIIRLVNVTDIIIVHDTETSSYEYERGLWLYPYRYHYTYLSTATDIASKYNETLFRKIKHLLELTISLKIPKRYGA